jgi:uncharacterized cupredoxin-like copper-binding protein
MRHSSFVVRNGGKVTHEIHFGCLVPGHFEAGMIGKLEVVK